MIRTDQNNPDLVLKYLKLNKVLILPTDTIYGLSCRVGATAAIRKVYKIKKRDGKKPPIILVGSWCMLKKYCYVSASQDKYLRGVWTPTASPTTVILRARDILSKNIIAHDGSVAVRLPKSQFLTKIIKLLGEPMISTSLNISQQKNLTSVKNLDEYFSEIKPDLVVDVGVVESQASKIIDVRDIKNIKIIR